MNVEKSYQPSTELDITEIVRKKVKASREEMSMETVDTLFYVAMKAYPDLFVITDEYKIGDHIFNCDLYEGGSHLETMLTSLFDRIKHRHHETFKIKSLFEENLKETMHLPIQYVKGFVVQNGSNIYPFSIFSPRETKRFEWVKSGVFSKKEVEVDVVKHDNELELANFYYQFAVREEEVSPSLYNEAKQLIVQTTHRKFNLSDEMYAYQKSEKMWTDFHQKGKIDINEFEQFIQGIYQFKETCSPEIKPLLDELYTNIFKKRSVLHQYELMRKHEVEGSIYID